jgi:hypothetical protein
MLTVVTPATTYRLTTVERAKIQLGFPDSQDDLVDQLIDHVSEAIARYCNRVLAREEVLETLRSPRSPIMLRRYPVVSVEAITPYGGTALLTTQYEYDSESGILRRLSGSCEIPWYCGVIEIEYTAGYLMPGEDGANLPSDLELAAIRALSFNMSRNSINPVVRSETVEGVGSITYATGGSATSISMSEIGPDAERLARPYRRMLLA